MTTPARRQYLEIKAQHQDAILLYQVGDFYETFDDDARLAARELQIVLTARSYGPGEQVPLAGVPVHALDTYAARLVARGHTVAICEQVSPPGRGLVKREVTRILTPGTVADPAMLPAARDNLLVAVALGRPDKATGHPASAGLAYVDVTTGAFACTEWSGPTALSALQTELRRLTPAEVLTSADVAAPTTDLAGGEPLPGSGAQRLTTCAASAFDAAVAHATLTRHFAVPTLSGFGCEDRPLAVAAAGAILTYLQRMNPALLRLVTGLRTYDTAGFVEVDARTWRTLEVVEPSGPASHPEQRRRPATLLSTLDAMRTAMGTRLLRRWLLQPLRERAALEERLDAVAAFHVRQSLREHAAAALDGLADVERLIARVVHGTATPRELHGLRLSLSRVPMLAAALCDVEAPALLAIRDALDPCEDVQRLIASAVCDPAEMEGRTICAGYDAALDGMVGSIASARAWIAGLEASERERTGIKSLKVGYNKVFGYYIEVTKSWLDRVPADYQRRQTIAGGERYVTAALKEHEALVLHAEERIAALETTLYAGVLERLAGAQARLRRTVEALAQADVYLALAEVALARGYVRPALEDSAVLEIVEGRHPIVETALDGADFIANDTRLDAAPEGASPSPALLLLTGPNMAGKSTYLRQVACIVLLAQIGSFVPARRARVGLVDRIFTRVGAEDDLARGLSTFMLEMVETSYILRHATSRSLVILDEVGRGTSTRDGLAIARAVIEHLHDRVGGRTLFATHYHELADMTAHLPRLAAMQMAVAECDGEAVFLHRVVPGASVSSYGIQVARMAGIPAAILDRAADLLAAAPNGAHAHALAERHAPYAANVSDPGPTALVVDERESESPDRELTLALAGLNIAAMTPLDALNLLFTLQQRALAALQMAAR